MPIRNSTVNVPFVNKRFYVRPNGVIQPDLSFSVNREQYTQARTWVNTPGYADLRRKKYPNLPMQPFKVTLTRYVAPIGQYYYSFAGNGTNSGGSYLYAAPCTDGDNVVTGFVTYTPTPAEIQAIDARARANTLSKLKSSSVNLAQAFAERRMTGNMLANSASRIAFCYYSLKRGDRLGALSSFAASDFKSKDKTFKGSIPKTFASLDEGRSRLSKTPVSNAWLELQYGWKPLLQDIYGSAEALANLPFRQREAKVVSSSQRTFSELTTFIGANSRSVVRRSCTYKIKYTIFRSTDNPISQTLAQFGISNPALLAWELLPYSFVVDWFLPIGKYLENIDATQGMSFSKGCKTTVLEAVATVHATTKPGATFFYGVDMKGSRKVVEVERTRLNAFPSNQLQPFKNPLSFDHVANALALLSQLRK